MKTIAGIRLELNVGGDIELVVGKDSIGKIDSKTAADSRVSCDVPGSSAGVSETATVTCLMPYAGP
jgi:hypothetical protein